jgi:hypothetical protein
MADDALRYLIRQHETAWKLASYHLDGLTTEECLWRPASARLHVRRAADGSWHADWPDREGYDVGPPSIAWLTWHVIFWWSMVLDHSFGDATLSRDDVRWPYADRPFGDVVAWVNVELTKNAAEIGYARFLHASRGE